MFGLTDLREFIIQKDGFEEMKVIWLTWFGRIDEERFAGLYICSAEDICRDLNGWKFKLRNSPCKWSGNYEISLIFWKLQNTILSGFRVCNNIYIIYEI